MEEFAGDETKYFAGFIFTLLFCTQFFFIYIIYHAAQRNKFVATIFVQPSEMFSLRCYDDNQTHLSSVPADGGRWSSSSSEWDTGVRRGFSCLCDPSLKTQKGPDWSGLGTCRGRALPSCAHPLRGLPIYTTRWWLDLSFNECYPSWPSRSCRTAVALSTSHCSLLPPRCWRTNVTLDGWNVK